jgi:phosphate transport system substrate-binding protein
MKLQNSLKSLAALLLLASLAPATQAQVKLHGAAALCAALKPHQAEIEAKSGQKVALVSKNAGLGLKDLLEGKADLAMVTASVKGAAAGINADAGSLANLQSATITADPILFLVHPSNPVDSLTLDQVKAMLTGQITNWNQVGGKDAPIKVFGLANVNGPRIALNEQLLGETDLAKSAAIRNSPKDISPIVAQVPEGIGFLGKSNLGPGVKVLKTDKQLEMAMLIVSSGAPNPEQKAVIEACQQVLGVKN